MQTLMSRLTWSYLSLSLAALYQVQGSYGARVDRRVCTVIECSAGIPRSRTSVSHSLGWGNILRPQPPHTRQRYEQKYGRKTVEFALF